MSECYTTLDNRVEIRRLERRSAKGVQTVRAMVVRVDVEDVEFWLIGSGNGEERPEQQCHDKDVGVFHWHWVPLFRRVLACRIHGV